MPTYVYVHKNEGAHKAIRGRLIRCIGEGAISTAPGALSVRYLIGMLCRSGASS